MRNVPHTCKNCLRGRYDCNDAYYSSDFKYCLSWLYGGDKRLRKRKYRLKIAEGISVDVVFEGKSKEEIYKVYGKLIEDGKNLPCYGKITEIVYVILTMMEDITNE